ncbi:unnamed protein product [Timema podura]|uniref:Uncharacterized protein n=1 Tax=Timema podura TaxID=61482 RepID=A0ABN7PDI2_TIMPD|nr:unnamed protein product [Timema podura]
MLRMCVVPPLPSPCRTTCLDGALPVLCLEKLSPTPVELQDTDNRAQHSQTLSPSCLIRRASTRPPVAGPPVTNLI